VGTIKTHESTRKLACRVKRGNARILTATERREAGRWFCSFTCEVRRAERPGTRPAVVVGVDLGITHLAVLSSPVPGVSDTDGLVPNPQHLGRAHRDLRRASRRVCRRVGPDPRTGARPSKRWEKANRAAYKTRWNGGRLVVADPLVSLVETRSTCRATRPPEAAGLSRRRPMTRLCPRGKRAVGGYRKERGEVTAVSLGDTQNSPLWTLGTGRPLG
jgi:putative transposase